MDSFYKSREWRDKKTVVHEGGEKPIKVEKVDLEERVKQIKGEN